MFIILPLIGEIERTAHTNRRFAFDPSYFVVSLGGLLVIFLAVGATCRDFARHLEIFWRSRPIGAVRWLLIKYLIGLSIALLICAIPLGLGIMGSGTGWRDMISVLVLDPMLAHWLAVYSIAFASGCLLRRPAHAAMLALTLMLGLIFLPTLHHRLAGFSLFEDHRSSLYFASMIFVAIVALSIIFAVVILDWRFEAGVRMIYSAIATAVLLSFFAATSHFGTQLPVLQTISLAPQTISNSVYVKGNRGLLLRSTLLESPEGTKYYGHPTVSTFQADDSRVVLGSAAPSTINYLFHTFNSNDAAVACSVDIPDGDGTNKPKHLQITFISLDGTSINSTMNLPAAWNSLIRKDTYCYLTPRILRDRLLIDFHTSAAGDQPRCATIDISDPAHPRLVSDQPFNGGFGRWRLSDVNEKEDGNPHRPVIRLPQIAGLSPRDRLQLLRFGAFDGEHVFEVLSDHIAEYALIHLTETQASFKEVNRYDESFLDRMLGGWGIMQLQHINGFLYVLRYSAGPIESTVCVYDTLGSKPMRQVAHFAAPSLQAFGVLPDGRMVAAGDKIWLVAAPQRSAK